MNLNSLKGFTLIEALVYLGLFSILMGGATVAAYNLFDAATHAGTQVMLQEETDFLLAKIDWVLSGTQAVTAPAAGASGNSLTVVKWDTSIGNPLVFTLSGTNLQLSKGGGTAVTLNNTNVAVTQISFNHIEGSGDGITPESVETAITTSARTASGAILMRQATTTVYLRH